MMEKTLVILKPSCLVRGLVGEVTKRFEQKGLRLCGMKMCQFSDDLMSEHYAQHAGKPFFQQLKDAMMTTPAIVCCYEGVDAVDVVRSMAGATSGRKAALGTIRGDLCMSFQENIVHTSDSKQNAEIELRRFFKPEEIFNYRLPQFDFLYAADEL